MKLITELIKTAKSLVDYGAGKLVKLRTDIQEDRHIYWGEIAGGFLTAIAVSVLFVLILALFIHVLWMVVSPTAWIILAIGAFLLYSKAKTFSATTPTKEDPS